MPRRPISSQLYVAQACVPQGCPGLESSRFCLFELDALRQPFLYPLDEVGSDFAELFRQLRLRHSRLDNVHQLQDCGGQLEFGEVDWPWPRQILPKCRTPTSRTPRKAL